MKLQIKTLTPIHIGNGETLKPLSYVSDRSFVYVLNMDNFFESLTGIQKQKYLTWLEPILYRLSEITDKMVKARDNPELKRDLNTQKRDLENQLSIEMFIKNYVNQNPVEFVKTLALYKVPFSQFPRSDGFKLFIKDGNCRVYIPGTEIKGSIRTSLLYQILQDDSSYSVLKSNVETFKNIFKSGVTPKEKIKALKNLSKEIEGKLLRGKENKANYDFLRFIQISDTLHVPFDKLRIETTKMMGTQRYTNTWIETIISNTEFKYELDVKDKYVHLEKLGLSDLKKYLKIEEILNACYHHSKDILEEESRYFSSKSEIVSLLERLKRENEPTSPLIRFGSGQGFLGVTIDFIMKTKGDSQLYDEAIREGVSFQRRWRTQKNNFPKTRRVIIDKNGSEKSILGWAKILKQDD